jgi:hypothetical protein
MHGIDVFGLCSDTHAVNDHFGHAIAMHSHAFRACAVHVMYNHPAQAHAIQALSVKQGMKKKSLNL